MKKFIALVLALVMVLSLATVAFAYDNAIFAPAENRAFEITTVFERIFKGIRFSEEMQEAMEKHDGAVADFVADCYNTIASIAKTIGYVMDMKEENFFGHHLYNNEYAQQIQAFVNRVVERLKNNEKADPFEHRISQYFSFFGFRVNYTAAN